MPGRRFRCRKSAPPRRHRRPGEEPDAQAAVEWPDPEAASGCLQAELLAVAVRAVPRGEQGAGRGAVNGEAPEALAWVGVVPLDAVGLPAQLLECDAGQGESAQECWTAISRSVRPLRSRPSVRHREGAEAGWMLVNPAVSIWTETTVRVGVGSELGIASSCSTGEAAGSAVAERLTVGEELGCFDSASVLGVVLEKGALVGALSARLPSEPLSCGQNDSASIPATVRAAIAT